MRHFSALPEEQQSRLFARPPEAFTADSDVPTLAVALGATLYLPATRPRLADDLTRQAARGVVSSVVCLEDAVADADVPTAQANAVSQLSLLAQRRGSSTEDDRRGGPLVFVRVRTPDQIGAVVDALGEHAGVVTGFVLPKFTGTSGGAFLEALVAAAGAAGHRLLAMPVMESPELIHRETRHEVLGDVRRLLDRHRDVVLAVRIGATDLCGAYGLRRDRDLTIYDVGVVAEVIADVVNVLGRADGTGHVITGPVWEHFSGHERLFKPQLRESPFDEHGERPLRHELITRDLDALIRETALDKANGLTGKTVIHPSHVGAVHALSVVTHEEFADASDILADTRGGGVAASRYRNKMNELKPHRAWAERTLARARAFGVADEGVSFVDLLAAGAPV